VGVYFGGGPVAESVAGGRIRIRRPVPAPVPDPATGSCSGESAMVVGNVTTQGVARPDSKHRSRFGLRAQILLGLAAVTLIAILTTGFLALWAAGNTLRAHRETEAVTLASAAARMASALVDRHGEIA